MSNPLLTFCISTYNNSYFIFDNVRDILANTQDNIQVVVSDDNSSDSTVLLLSTIEDPRFKLVVNVTTQGHSLNLINALHNADGEYCFILNDHDRILNDSLNPLLKTLSTENYDIILSRPSTVDSAKIVDYTVNNSNTLKLEKILTLLTYYYPTGLIFKKNLVDFNFLFNCDDELLADYSHIYISSLICHNDIFITTPCATTSIGYIPNTIDNYMRHFNILSIWLEYTQLQASEQKIILMQLFITFLNIVNNTSVNKVPNFDDIANNYPYYMLDLLRKSETYPDLQKYLNPLMQDFLNKATYATN